MVYCVHKSLNHSHKFTKDQTAPISKITRVFNWFYFDYLLCYATSHSSLVIRAQVLVRDDLGASLSSTTC